MMGWNWNYAMMSGNWGIFNIVGLIVLADLILLGVWLWKQINKK